MTRIRYHTTSRDKNHKEIVRALEGHGLAVIDLTPVGDGAPDIIACSLTSYWLMEIKNLNSSHGKKGASYRQLAWAFKWKGKPVFVVSSVEEAIKIVSG